MLLGKRRSSLSLDSNKYWQYLQLSKAHKLQSKNITPYRYYYTNSQSYYELVKSVLRHYPNFEFRYEAVQGMQDVSEGVVVSTSQNTYHAKWVFSSLAVIPPKNTLSIRQHFRGWYIRTQEPSFDDQSIRLMDFRTSQQDGASFFYMLPLSPYQALVEYTVISKKQYEESVYEQKLEHYIKQVLGIAHYELLHQKKGLIPMTNYRFPRRSGKHIMRIGTAGGMTKACTGFTYKNMLEDAREIVRQLEKNGQPFYKTRPSTRFRFYDNLLLYILKNHPMAARHIFEKMFSKNKGALILRFLDEKTTLWEEASLFISLPWPPYLNALWSYYMPDMLKLNFSWTWTKPGYYANKQSTEAQ